VSKQLSVSELLRLACIYAEQDRESWLQAMDNCRGDRLFAKQIADGEAFLKQLRNYRIARWGKGKRETLFETTKAVPIHKVAGRSAPNTNR